MTYENVCKTATGQRGDYTTDCLLVKKYPYCKENYRLITIDLKKELALGVDPRRTQQISFIQN